ncbi:MAG: ATP-binding protein [Candidatus Binataceae bacterium]
MKTIFDLCEPRSDVIKGDIAKADFAADLAQVIKGAASREYLRPELFFANTYPTRGLKSLLANVCARLSGKPGEVAAVFRLGTSFGGGKTHALIALVHAANGMRGVSNSAEFIDSSLVPQSRVRIAAFDGDNADPANGRKMSDDVLAFTPWGEIAYLLAGKAGYERVRRSDEEAVAPGAETLQELFGGEPALILLDELSVYLRKVQRLPQAREQLAAFLTSLFKAVESSPQAAVVYTLSIGKDGRSGDAYSEESQFIADRMAEIESVSARKATLLNPTEDDETVRVLRRRLFDRIDDRGAAELINAYRECWNSNREALLPDATRPETIDALRASYPFHPDVLATLTGKTATLATFQRVRGMLRLLAGTVACLWNTRPADATAIHLHHIDPGFAPIYEEITTRLQQRAYVPAIRNDIVAAEPGRKALAQEIDDAHYRGMPPYATYAARAIFMHTLAYNDQLKGVTPEHLRYSILGPETDISFIDDARKRFFEDSSYLDDRPIAPLRFLVEANLTQIIRRQEDHADSGEVRAQLNDRIKRIFGGNSFEMIPFASGEWEVPDDAGDGRPRLVVMSYDAVTAGAGVESVPGLVARIFARKNADGNAFRELRNNLLFVVADQDKIGEMRRAMIRRLALAELRKPERLGDLAEHQKAKILELEERSELDAALAIQQCYQHVFYPSRNRLPRTATLSPLWRAKLIVRSHPDRFLPQRSDPHSVPALADSS